MNLAAIINPAAVPPGTPSLKWGYYDCPDTDYHRFPAISSGLLKCATLAEMYSYMTEPGKQTEALALGALADMTILTPEVSLHDRFHVFEPPVNKTTGEPYKGGKRYDEAKAEAQEEAESAGKFLVTMDEFEDLAVQQMALRQAFSESALCVESLKNAMLQVSGFMWHPVWECWVKWKPDILPHAAVGGVHIIADLKTSRRHVLHFEKDCHEFDYWGQAGWYAHCHETLLKKRGLPLRVGRFRFLVIGKPDAGRRPRRAMARVYDVPLDPALNDYMRTFHTRVFPADGMGKVELFLAALREHVEKAPDASTEAGKRELRRIWGAYEDESAPYLLCRLPRVP